MGRGFPTTRDGAERAIVIAFIGWRIAVCAQLSVGLSHGIDVSPRPAWYVAIAAACLGESAVVCAWSAIRRRLIGQLWAWGEIAGCAALLLTMPLVVPADMLVGTWVAFAPGFAHAVMSMNCAVLIAAKRYSRGYVAAAISIVTVSYLVTELPGVAEDLVGTVVANAVTYPAAGIILTVIAAYLRSMASAADEARGLAARSAEELERRRNQLLMHDSASILHLLATNTPPAELADALREQAAIESAKILSFLAEDRTSGHEGETQHISLAQVVSTASTHFADLPIEATVDIGGDIELDPECAEAVAGAIRAVLHNIRRYAHAEEVVIHTGADSGNWDLSIRDDGRGFDTASTAEGFGLRMQVRSALAQFGIDVSLTSEPGEGTVVVLRGARQHEHASAARLPARTHHAGHRRGLTRSA